MSDLSGKTMVITGASDGVGLAAARVLAARGARLVLVGRNPAKTSAVLESLPPPGQGAHTAFIADLTLMAETRRVAGEIARAAPVIDVLINNAGAIFGQRQITPEGLERTFALNHMAYFVMTRALLANVAAAPRGRVIVTASRAHEQGWLDWDDVQSKRGLFLGFQVYARSKMCNILFARALAKRVAGSSVTANALHPGFVASRFGYSDTSPVGAVIRFVQFAAKTPEQGAQTTIWAATSEEAGRLNGAYFADSRPAKPTRYALSDEHAERLWAISEEIAGRDG